jgi:hypothetical protein
MYLGDKLVVQHALLTLSVHFLLADATENVNSLASPVTTFLSVKHLNRLGSTDCGQTVRDAGPLHICVSLLLDPQIKPRHG